MPQVYGETFEQIEHAEQLGLDLCWFTEHHFIPDGYLPNFVPVAAAAASRSVATPTGCRAGATATLIIAECVTGHRVGRAQQRKRRGSDPGSTSAVDQQAAPQLIE